MSLEPQTGSPLPAVSRTPPEPLPEDSPWRVGTLVYTRSQLVRLFSWLLWGDFAWSIRDRTVVPVLQLLLRRFQASDTVAGLLSGTVPAACGLVLGPIISFRSDRLRTRRGRRLPFLLISAPVAAVAIVGLGFSPVLGQRLDRLLGPHSPGPFPSVLIVLALWWIVFDLSTTIANSVFGALINDTVPHGVIGRFYGLFRTVSLIVGIAFNYWLLSAAQVHFQWMFAAVGLIYGVGVVLMCLNVREGDYPPPDQVEGHALVRFFVSARTYFRQCFTHPYYLWFFAAYNLGMAAPGPVNLYSVYFAKSLLMSTATFGKYLAATYFISLFVTYLLGLLADRFHPLRMSMVAITLYGLVTLWGGFSAMTVGTFAVAILLHGVFSGMFFTVSASLGQRLLPQENFAQFSSANGIIGGLLSVLLPSAIGYSLDCSQHNYRITYFAASALSLLALACLAVVYRYWHRLGGPHHFVAPEV